MFSKPSFEKAAQNLGKAVEAFQADFSFMLEEPVIKNTDSSAHIVIKAKGVDETADIVFNGEYYILSLRGNRCGKNDGTDIVAKNLNGLKTELTAWANLLRSQDKGYPQFQAKRYHARPPTQKPA